ncbi:bifunctional protein GlmU [Sneathiella chinensis]|uniref:Bifunctional protein GlmU n=2 Tax=Sneathiella chinensis TaxID=349750 RepID=A0ABQ5U6J0_9PROT|nr:bifunctional protein GlmU [Sneathiella chinensis]
MKSSKAKVLHQIAGRPMISHLLSTVDEMQPARKIVVVAPHMDDVRAEVAPAETAIQPEALGTGSAVAAALPALEGFDGSVLVLFGDCPLITLETLQDMAAGLEGDDNTAAVILGFEPEDPAEYGRLVVAEDGTLDAIVEYADASEAERAIRICNSGVMAIRGRHLKDLITSIDNNNAKNEYYLTSIVEIAKAKGLTCKVAMGDEEELLGVNNRVQLAEAEAVVQKRWRVSAMMGGATLIDPASVFLSHDTRLGRDVVIEPNVVFGPGVVVGDGVRIKAHSHIEGAVIGNGAQVGPFARLRPGAVLAEDVKIGNFVEIKKSDLEKGAKVSHLSYIGDARVGAEANIGAGTITCNYDGYDKYRTDIGKGAFIGSNTALVAPVVIGDGAIVGAGSTVARDVEADALALVRAEQVHKQGWAERFRKMKLRLKNKTS